MLLIIVIAAIALILIIPGKKKKSTDFSPDGGSTIKPKQTASFLTVIGNFIRKMLKGK